MYVMAKATRRRSVSSRRQKSRRQSASRRSVSNRRVKAGSVMIMVAGAFAIVGILLNAGFSFSSEQKIDNNVQGLSTAYEVELAAKTYSQNTGTYFNSVAMQCLKEKCSNRKSATSCVANYAEFCTS